MEDPTWQLGYSYMRCQREGHCALGTDMTRGRIFPQREGKFI